MYSIFNTKTRKHNYLEEGEPPPKRALIEEDILIKKLSQDQLKTNITLAEHLNRKKEFTSSKFFTNITSFVSGKSNLEDFQLKVDNVDELNNLKNKGLTDKDIEIYRDYITLGEEFWMKYKSVSGDILYKRINEIKLIVDGTSESDFEVSLSCSSKYLEKNTLPLSTAKILEIATENESKKKYMSGPMDELPNLDKQFMDNIEEYSSCNVEKIRKKARSIGHKIENLETDINLISSNNSKLNLVNNRNIPRPTLWDNKEKPTYLEKKIEIIDKDKIYTCKPQNWYTVKDNKIIKLDENKMIPKNSTTMEIYTEKSKLTSEEIKNIPKFSNYDPGKPSKTLYLKNLGKNIVENCLRKLLKEFKNEHYSVKLMNGKMRGQAFIEFHDESQASDALEVLNGVILENKPIIAQFGRKKDT